MIDSLLPHLYEVFFIVLTVSAFVLSRSIYARWKFPLLHPVLLSAFMIIALLPFLRIDYQTYYSHTEVLKFFLNISVVTFGYLLYINVDYLIKCAGIIIFTNILGSAIGIWSVILLSKIFGLSDIIMNSLIPKSMTTPLAILGCDQLGGIEALAVTAVVICGIFGSVIGPLVFKVFKIDSHIAMGIALGTASHGIGTARASEYSLLAGAMGGLSIALMGIFTSLMISIFL